MPTTKIKKIKTKRNNLYLRVAEGHFATAHAHSNYFVDVAVQKSRLSEATAVAKALMENYNYSTTVVDTILCLDGTEVIGTCLASELTKNNFVNINAHQTIYIVTPEAANGSQLLFRDNIVDMIRGKHVLVLAVSVATGYTVKAAIEAIEYYGGEAIGVASIFATTDDCAGHAVNSVFNPTDLPEYFSLPSHACPLCKQGEKIDALVNCHGFSKL